MTLNHNTVISPELKAKLSNLETAEKVADDARNNPAPEFYPPDLIVRDIKELAELLPLIDIIFANEDEAREFFAEEEFDPQTALEKLSAICPVAVVKVGSKGAWIKENEDVIHVDARMVKAIDTTGAGDLWQAGFLYGYLTGRGIEFAGCLGAAVSAEVVQVMGAELPQEAWERLKNEFGC